MYAAGRVDFARASSFNLDEFVGIDRLQPGSFHRFMDEHLFTAINIPRSRIGFLNGVAADLEAECQRYEAAIASAGGIDLQLLGIGRNGHIGFNEPADALTASTHPTTLLPDTRRANAALFGGDASRVPARALTMGIGTILGARAIVLMATGEAKAAAIAAAVSGLVTPRVPASFLQLHARGEVYLDREAAACLPRST
jgi:glucosamine-6-phosphate deaminase